MDELIGYLRAVIDGGSPPTDEQWAEIKGLVAKCIKAGHAPSFIPPIERDPNRQWRFLPAFVPPNDMPWVWNTKPLSEFRKHLRDITGE